MPASSQENAQPTAEPRSSGKPLFSQHWLQHRLPAQPESQLDWQPVFAKVCALWQHARQFGDTWSESQTEDEFVKPVFGTLGWICTVQTKSRYHGSVSRPDYSLFADQATKLAAQPSLGDNNAFYSRVLAIGEAKRWGRPLSETTRGDEGERKPGNPNHQMVSYLDNTSVPWGILTIGSVWRLYSREVNSPQNEFHQVDLAEVFDKLPPDSLPTVEQITAFKLWWIFFRCDSFIPGTDGKCFVQHVYEGSAAYAKEVSDKLTDIVFTQAIPAIAGGFVAYRAQQKGVQQETEANLLQIYQASLSLLYKLLFVLYAEARNLLPVANPSYREQSLTTLAAWAAQAYDQKRKLSSSTMATPKYNALLNLFRRIDGGDRDLGIPHYNGGLFSPQNEHNQFLEKHKLSDQAIADTVDALARETTASGIRQNVDYAYISVRNLGAIHEGLLENKLRVIAAANGKVELVNDRGERKASGSYYTPDYVVDYIIQHTLSPILDERAAQFAAAMDRIAPIERKREDGRTSTDNANTLTEQLKPLWDEARQAFLGIKVCDPAMGSGHFLVNAVDILTKGIISRVQAYYDTHPEVKWEWNPIQRLIEQVRRQIVAEMESQRVIINPAQLDDTALLTRLVMKRCIYGVDINPMAVELAKVSLWLHTFTVGAPLSFLDHHLRWGNSLIGADVRTVQQALAATEHSTKVSEQTRAHAKMRGEEARQLVSTPQFSLFAGPFAGLLPITKTMLDVAARADATLADVQASAAGFASFE